MKPSEKQANLDSETLSVEEKTMAQEELDPLLKLGDIPLRDLIRILLGLFLMLALATHGAMDPDLFNLYSPPWEIENWLGAGGALIGGTLLFMVGNAAWLLGLALVLLRHKQPEGWLASLTSWLLLSIFTLMFLAMILPFGAELLIPWLGLGGFLTNLSLASFPGRLISLAILVGALVKLGRKMEAHSGLWLLSQWVAKALLSMLDNVFSQNQRLAKAIQQAQGILASWSHGLVAKGGVRRLKAWLRLRRMRQTHGALAQKQTKKPKPMKEAVLVQTGSNQGQSPDHTKIRVESFALFREFYFGKKQDSKN